MKKWMLITVLMMVLFTSCVSVQRGVKGNTFYSTSPQVALELDPKFEYIDKNSKSEWSMFYNSLSGTQHDVERHVFVDQVARAALVITIKSTHKGYWIIPNMKDRPNLISHGSEKHFGAKYDYNVRTYEKKNGGCEIIKEYVRVSGGKSDTITYIVYIEGLDAEDGTCNAWSDNVNTNPEKMNRVDEFLANCEQRIKFIDVNSLEIAKK